jgi:hypothetical protein
VIDTQPPGEGFGKRSGDVGEILLAASVLIGQLGTPSDSVRYGIILTDHNGDAFNGTDTYLLSVPADIVEDDGYFSVTVYGTDNKLLIPNRKCIYDRTSYTSKRNSDGSYDITLSPDGGGKNAIPTGKPFYAILRAYVPVQDADVTSSVEKAWPAMSTARDNSRAFPAICMPIGERICAVVGDVSVWSARFDPRPVEGTSVRLRPGPWVRSSRMWRWTLVFIVAALAGAACAESDDSGGDTRSAALECEIEGYPCSLTEVPSEILERSDRLSDEAVDMFAAGAARGEVDAWLNSQEGMADVESDDQAVWFRLDGGRGTWILRSSALGTRSAPSAESVRRVVPASRTVMPFVVRPDSEEKRALVLSPFLWNFGPTDDGPRVANILRSTRGYEGRVTFASNASSRDTEVSVDSFRNLDRFDVVHVATHGIRLGCKEGPCRAAIAAQVLQGPERTEDGVSTLKVHLSEFDDRGLELAKVEGTRGLELDLKFTLIMLSADFFRGSSGELQNTLIFFNACETLGSNGTDLAEAVRGDSSVYLGWDETVASDSAFAAALALYESLAEHGYPAEVAYDRLGALRFDPLGEQEAVLEMAERSGDEDLRIRDVVELLEPGSSIDLSPSSSVAIIGTEGDGEPDSVPYSVQVDGITSEFAGKVILHVSINGTEVEPQPLANGQVDENDRWIVNGEAPLGFDVEEATTVDFTAWVDLHSGGESKDETPATVAGEEPIMGLIWEMESTESVHRGVKTAKLTLKFEAGQDVNEPHPRYVVTGGTVTYAGVSASDDGCSYSSDQLTFEVTPAMSPPSRDDGFASSVLIFDTTVTPVQYRGVIYTQGPHEVVTQNCPVSGVNPVDYGGNVSWMIVDASDHLTVEDRKLISDTVNPADGHTISYTITRTK